MNLIAYNSIANILNKVGDFEIEVPIFNKKIGLSKQGGDIILSDCGTTYANDPGSFFEKLAELELPDGLTLIISDNHEIILKSTLAESKLNFETFIDKVFNAL